MAYIQFYDFPSSQLVVIGALGITTTLAVFFISYKKYFNSPLNKELIQKKKALLQDQKDLRERLEKIEKDLKKLSK